MADTFNTHSTAPSHRATLLIKDGGDFKRIGDVTGFNWPGVSRPVLDATHSTSKSKEKLAGRPDVGQVSCTINYRPGSPAHLAIEAAARSSEVSEFKVVDDGVTDAPGASATFSGWVTDWAPDASGEESVFSGTITIEVTGDVTYAAG